MKKYDVAIIGGDKRTACMASVFANKGYQVICFGIGAHSPHEKIHHAHSLQSAVSQAPVIVGGIPFAKDGGLYFEEAVPSISLAELQRLLRKPHRVFGGIIPEAFQKICAERSIDCFDFMQEETLTILNAAATAEGAILEALLHKDTLLHQSRVLLLGYGRCGKVLADRLKGLTARVTVCTASPTELASASAMGLCTLPLHQLPHRIDAFEYIFNTVPAPLLNRSCLEQVQPEALIIDIASNRTGADYEAAESLKRKLLFCPGLPGKYAGESCAGQLVAFVLEKTGKETLNESER